MRDGVNALLSVSEHQAARSGVSTTCALAASSVACQGAASQMAALQQLSKQH
jgi:hypothetical protein